MSKNKIILKNWSIILKGDQYTPPEFCRQCLSGKVYGHPNFEDGEEVTTSSIKGQNTDGDIIVSSGKVYHLESIDPYYEKKYPDAEARFKLNCPVII